MDPFEAMHGSRSTSPIEWFEVGEPLLLGRDLIYKTSENVPIIRNRFQTSYSQQKSYVNHRRRDLEFEEGDNEHLKISPMKGVVDLRRKSS